MSMVKVRVALDNEIGEIERFRMVVAFIDRMLDSIDIIQHHVTITELQYLQGRGYRKSDVVKKIENDVYREEVGSPIICITPKRIYNDLSDGRSYHTNIISLYGITETAAETIRKIVEMVAEIYPNKVCEAELRYFRSTSSFPLFDKELAARERLLPLGDAVMVVHGMCTQARWERTLATYLNKPGTGWSYFTSEYGVFRKVMWPRAWKGVRDEVVLKNYRNFLRDYPRKEWRHHVVTHSFGTYLFADMLLTHGAPSYPESILFVASIVASKTDWTSIVAHGTRIVCECAGKDKVLCAAPALWLTGAGKVGRSGVKGFRIPHDMVVDIEDAALSYNEFVRKVKENQHKRIINVFYPYKGHSDFFNEAHFEERWLPLLAGC